MFQYDVDNKHKYAQTNNYCHRVLMDTYLVLCIQLFFTARAYFNGMGLKFDKAQYLISGSLF